MHTTLLIAIKRSILRMVAVTYSCSTDAKMQNVY